MSTEIKSATAGQIALKWGIIFIFIFIIETLVFQLLGTELLTNTLVGMSIGLVNILLTIYILFASSKELRTQEDNLISFGRAYGQAMKTTLISAVGLLFFALVYNLLIIDFDTNFLEMKSGIIKSLKEKGLSDKDINNQIKFMEFTKGNPYVAAASDAIGTLIGGVFYALISSAIVKRSPKNSNPDVL